jgi:hypothetical protein
LSFSFQSACKHKFFISFSVTNSFPILDFTTKIAVEKLSPKDKGHVFAMLDAFFAKTKLQALLK